MASADKTMLSIVVPCYKSERFLPRCIDSLLAQTYRNIEIICVNDGSPDGCLDIMRRYEASSNGLVRIVDKQNGGLWNARWSGTEVAQGEYVAYLDSDDYVTPAFAEDFVRAAEANDADIVVCGFMRIDEKNDTTVSTEMSDERPAFFPREDPGKLIEINPAAWNKCYRRDLLLRMNRLENPPLVLEDVTLTQLAYLAAEKKVAFTGTATYYYCLHEGSMINTLTLEQVASVKKALLEVKDAFVREAAPQNLVQSLDATVFLHLGVSVSYRLSYNASIDLKQSIADTTAYLNEHFPSWSSSAFINLKNAKKSGAFAKLYIARCFYKAHLMVPFLAAYRFYLAHSSSELKW